MRFATRPALLLFFLSLVTSPAVASPILTLQQGNSIKTIKDLDRDGIVTYAGSVGGYDLNFTAGVSTASAGSAVLDLFSFDLNAAFGAAPLTITLTDSSFYLPAVSYGSTVTAEGTVDGSLYALGGGNVTFQSMVNDVSLYSPAATFTSGNFSTKTSNVFPYLGQSSTFSLFSQAVIKLNGPGAVSFNQSVSAKSVPEPGSLGLLAVGLFGARVVARRKAKARV